MQCDPKRLRADVELMDDPCLWRSEIRVASRGEVVADSWTKTGLRSSRARKPTAPGALGSPPTFSERRR